ncbi:rod shape-determining protein MreD [Candidatus Pandoraea novymonadis]|uniref:Rod shape-determining protein MreD n=1 Tax=Candidatus Pandoraea novymonadis TaxID=1808959 RepID=A0ABX5FFL8_9BURK|nr:rod shape-determining protein MreD [Candidatus Pandoraea novymonadis]PSB92471.1 Rod shape-determining protein MreD [Candidatus Pandoraea novymonadis]
MNRPQYVLLRVNRYFITLSLVLAFLLNLLPWGKNPMTPDFFALVLIFWNIHQPRKVRMSVAFIVGVLIDVHRAVFLGEHALVYTLLSYGAIMIHRRVLWVTPLGQTLHVLPLLLLAYIVRFIIRLVAGTKFPGWLPLATGFIEALLWPVICLLLLAPQKCAVDRDDTRPI